MCSFENFGLAMVRLQMPHWRTRDTWRTPLNCDNIYLLQALLRYGGSQDHKQFLFLVDFYILKNYFNELLPAHKKIICPSNKWLKVIFFLRASVAQQAARLLSPVQ